MERRHNQPQPTRKERREQAREERRQDAHDLQIRQGRIRALKWVGGAGLTAVGLAVASQTTPGRTLVDSAVNLLQKDEEYSGEVDQTKALLDKWHLEVGQDGKRLKEYAPRISDLAVAYFSKQMTEMFPDRKEKYDLQVLRNATFIVDEKGFLEAHVKDSCGLIERSPNDAVGFAGLATKSIYINLERLPRIAKSGEHIRTLFLSVIHELLHVSSDFKQYADPVQTVGFLAPVDIQVGLGVGWLNKLLSEQKKQNCLREGFWILEEVVVEDATNELSTRVGVKNVSPETDVYARIYSQKIKSLFHGDFKELLRYQQESDVEGYFRAVGNKLPVAKNVDARITGFNYINQNVITEARRVAGG